MRVEIIGIELRMRERSSEILSLITIFKAKDIEKGKDNILGTKYKSKWYYKRSNSDVHFSNDYDVALKGVRMVPEMGFFLKEED